MDVSSHLSWLQQDLVDFALGSGQLWAVWHTTQGDAAVSCARLDSSSPDWQPAILEQPPERDFIATDAGTDPRQAYISYIFHPGQFPLTVIAKALGVSHEILSVLCSFITVRFMQCLEFLFLVYICCRNYSNENGCMKRIHIWTQDSRQDKRLEKLT